MIIKTKAGNLNSVDIGNRYKDIIKLEWHETSKRILHKITESGRAVTLKFLQENPAFTEGDIVAIDEESVIMVEIPACKVIIIHPANMLEAASVCYEIGNKHLPLFIDDEYLLIPYDASLFKLLTGCGYSLTLGEKKLLNPIRTSVAPHAHSGNNSSLLTRILQATNSL